MHVQDVPGWFGTWVCVLEGVKHVAVWSEWKGQQPQGPVIWRDVSTPKKLLRLKSAVQGWEVYELHGGESLFVPGGQWHAAVNSTCCVSINVSLCKPADLQNCMIKAITGQLKSYAFDTGMLHLIEQEMSACLKCVQERLDREGAQSVCGSSFAALEQCEGQLKIISRWAWCIHQLDTKLLCGASQRWRKQWLWKLKTVSVFP